MIKTLCPEGVERVKLCEICEGITTGTLNMRSLPENGIYPVLNSGKEITGYNDKYNNDCEAITIASRGEYAGFVNYANGKFWAGILCYPFKLKENSQNLLRYIYYILKKNEVDIMSRLVSRGGIPALNKNDVENYKIPLPPLSVQQEIVSVLDSFTTLIDKMKKEVELRKKQMEYYREKLMSPRDNWEIKTLGEIGTFTKGTGLLKSDFREMGFPCIHYGQIHTYYNTVTVQTISFCEESYANKLRKASYGDLLIATTSEDVEACCKAVTWLGKGEVAYSGDSHCFSHNQDPKFVAYLFQTEMFAKQKRMAATGAKVVRVSGESMATFSFAFPHLSIQHSIVRTLDAFDSYITKLEKLITLREKQYEYYREKLLTFE